MLFCVVSLTAFGVGDHIQWERAFRSIPTGVVREATARFATKTHVHVVGGENVIQALRSERDDDRAGLIVYLAAVHDTAAVLAAQEIDAGCCEVAAVSLQAALDHWHGSLKETLAGASPDASPVLVLWRAAARAPLFAPTANDVQPNYTGVPRAAFETLPKETKAMLVFLLQGGFTREEVRKKFPATDPTVLRCLPP